MKRFAFLVATVIVLLSWWASGLGRKAADPRDFFTEEQIDRAASYNRPKYLGYATSLALGLTVLAVLAFTPVGERLLRPVRALPWPVGAASAVVLVLATRAAIRLPLSFWRGHLHERRWGFSTQSAVGWFGDWGKSLATGMAITVLAFVGLVWLVRVLPRAWPGVAAAGAAALVVLLTFLAPVVFEPLFNRFTPLPDRGLAAELRSLSGRAGVPVKEVLVSDASRRTTKENAYVSGIGGTRRLVLYDTLLRNASREEVRLVVAHELGHRRSRHVEIGTLFAAAAAAASVTVIWMLSRPSGMLTATGAGSISDPRAFPLVLLVIELLGLAAQPATNWVSRRMETSADSFALSLTADRDAYVSTERRLALRNLGNLDPNPIVYRFLFTHPAPAERLALALGDVRRDTGSGGGRATIFEAGGSVTAPAGDAERPRRA